MKRPWWVAYVIADPGGEIGTGAIDVVMEAPTSVEAILREGANLTAHLRLQGFITEGQRAHIRAWSPMGDLR